MFRCESLTAKGTRCVKFARPGSNVCVLHAKMQEHAHSHNEGENDLPVFAPDIPEVTAPALAPVLEMTDISTITE